MGCDIHLYIERKNKEGKWEEIKDIPETLIPDGRNYSVFAFLANVRNHGDTKIKPQFEGRGFPDDTSIPENDTDDFWIGDHSFTYASLNEILNAPWEEFELKDSYFYVFFRYVLPRLCCPCGWCGKEECDKIRIIMGFDN